MNLRTICLIDDAIPVSSITHIDDSKRLNSSNLQALLDDKIEWQEAEVKSLVEALLNDKESWIFSAFTNPSTYLNSVIEENYRPDIIIFDWDYPAPVESVESILLEILNKTFALVYIYSRDDNKRQIETALEQPGLEKYVDARLFTLMKSQVDSDKMLLKRAEEFYENNFSFRFGSLLRNAALKALDTVLVQLGDLDVDFIKCMLGDGETGETDVKSFLVEKMRHSLLEDQSYIELLRDKEGYNEDAVNELTIYLIGKIMALIHSSELNLSLFPVQMNFDETKKDLSKRLWSLRIYYKPSDAVVRRGDIIYDNVSERTYMIITADCDLYRFWNKNFGFVNVVPLYDVIENSEDIKAKLGLTRNPKQTEKVLNSIKPKSLTGKICGAGFPEGPFMLPFIKVEDKFLSYIGFPKEITSYSIEPPELKDNEEPGERRNTSLTYKHLEGYSRIATISEPFQSAIVQHCVVAISGLGTPDYPKIVGSAICEAAKKSIKIIDASNDRNTGTN